MEQRIKVFKDWINRKYIEWMAEQGEVKTLTEFSEYIGENQPTVSHWINGKRVPGEKQLLRLAKFFGPEVLRVTGYIDEFDEQFQVFQWNWDLLDEEDKVMFLEVLEKRAEEKGKKLIGNQFLEGGLNHG